MSQREEQIDDIDLLLSIMPPRVQERLTDARERERLIEIVLDLGRLPEARFTDREIAVGDREVTRDDLDHVVQRIGEFGGDNRAGIERTLHRISAIRNRRGEVVGLTCRVGRAVFGTIDIVRDLIDSGHSILLLGKPGVGKCVTADSLVLTGDGLLPLADLVPDGLEDDSFAPIDGVQVWGMNGLEAASHAYSGGLSPTVRVTTRQGFRLEGTLEHPVLAMQEDGELAFRPLRDLRPGDYVAIQRGQGCFGRETRLSHFEFTPRTNARDGKVPTELTEELARFLGYLVAEGTLSHEKSVSFCHTEAEIQAEMRELTDALFGLQLREHLHEGRWNGKDFRIFGVKLRRFLLHLGLAQGRAADKRIPDCILTAPKPMVAAFLQALFEGDGSVYGSHGRVELATASRELATQLHVLLLNFGIVGNLRAKHNAAYDRDYYSLTLLGDNVRRFAEQIGFRSTRKRERLAQIVAKMGARARNPNVDILPHQTERLRTLRRHTQSRATTTSGRFTRADERAPSRRVLARILDESQAVAATPVYQALQTLLETQLFFDPVTRLEEGEAYVYDLSVPGSHSFFANGFVSHNTTLLRETARVLAEAKRVVIVDTSNEIAGDGDIPHPAIGRARRMQVPTPELQHEIMIEAVENHTPQVIVIDEIGREEEASAARTIAERGVQLVGTAHGNQLDNLMMNPTLSDLVGGIASVTLSDEEARRRGTQKSVLERKAPPTFDVVVEIQDRDTLNVHLDVSAAVDALLRGRPLSGEVRHRTATGEIETREQQFSAGEALQRATGRMAQPEDGRRGPRGRRDRGPLEARRLEPSDEPYYRPPPSPPAAAPAPLPTPQPAQAAALAPREGVRPLRLYPYGISQNRLKQAARAFNVPISIVAELSDADVLITLRSYYRKRPPVVAEAERRGTTVHVLRSNTVAQMEEALAAMFGLESQSDPFELALREAREAIEAIRRGAPSIELAPQDAYTRHQQHDLARAANLLSRSKGKEPQRRVRYYANNGV